MRIGLGIGMAPTPFAGGVATGIPVNTSAPTISGIQTVGQTLTVSNGAWTQFPTGFTYQWKKSGAPISGATANTHTIVSGEAGTAITCDVTATNSFGSATQGSSSVTPAAAFVATGAPGTTGSVGGTYSFTPSHTGGHTPLGAWSISGSLTGSGLSFNTTTGAITATTLGSAGTYGPFTITGTDADGLTSSLAPFSIVVGASITITVSGQTSPASSWALTNLATIAVAGAPSGYSVRIVEGGSPSTGIVVAPET